jgi:hypothetical protein
MRRLTWGGVASAASSRFGEALRVVVGSKERSEPCSSINSALAVEDRHLALAVLVNVLDANRPWDLFVGRQRCARRHLVPRFWASNEFWPGNVEALAAYIISHQITPNGMMTASSNRAVSK